MRRSGLLVAIAVAVSLVFVPVACALFYDVGTTGGGIAGATLSVTLTETGPASQASTTDESGANAVERTWVDYEHATDGSETVRNTLTVDAVGSSDVETLNLTVDYRENDSTLGSAGNGPNTTRTVIVQSFTVNGTELVDDRIVDENGNGRIDVEDLMLGSTADNLSALSGPTAGGNTSIHIEFVGKATILTGVGSDDGVDVSLTVCASTASFVDCDVSTNNTVRYA